MSNKYFLFAIAVIFGCLLVLRQFEQINTGQVIEIFVLTVLVIATAWYAQHTKEIAKATKEQADASVRPYLLLRLTNEWVEWPLSGKELAVTIRNEGKGPAINVEASLWHPKTIHPCDSRGYLASGEEWKVNLSTSDVGVPYKGEKEVRPWLPELKDIIKEHKTGAVVVRYHDIQKRNWLSYLSFEWHGDVPYVRDGEQNIVEWKKDD